MQKKPVVVLSFVTVALAGSFYITGLFAEHLLGSAIEKLNNNDSIKIKIDDYRRGFFSSRATLSYTDSSNTSNLTLNLDIAHGPVVFAQTPQGTKIRFAAGRIYTTPTDSLLSNKLLITSIIGFDSQAISYLDIDGVLDESPSGFRVSWEPVHGEFRHDLSFGKLNGTLSMPSFSLANNQWSLEINAFNMQREGMFVGNEFRVQGKASLQELKFTRQQVELIKVNHCLLTEIATVDQEIGNLQVDLDVDKARIIDQKFSQERISFYAKNIRRSVWDNNVQLASILSPKSLAEHAANVTNEIASGAELNLEFPKTFSEALLSYLSFEIYRASPVGQVDPRPPLEVLADITTSIVSLFQESVKSKLLLENDNKYALNFDLAK